MSTDLSDEAFFILCTREVSGETTPEEKRQLEELLEDPDNRRIFDSFKGAWDDYKDPYADASYAPSEIAWQRLQKRLGLDETVETSAPVVKPRQAAAKKRLLPLFDRHPIMAWTAAAAACFVLGSALSVTLTTGPESGTGTTALPLKIYATLNAQQTDVTLPDGSNVRLNADTRLTLSAGFGQSSRSVSLSGEAFFNVSHDPERPFIVTANDIQTTVLGTQFNIRAFEDDHRTTVTLLTGKVEVQVADNANGSTDALTLEPNQQYRYDEQSKAGSVVVVNPQAAMSWMQNKLIFDDEPLDQVLKTLGRHYDVWFVIHDADIAQHRLSLSLKGESLDETLRILESLGKFNFKRNYTGHRISSVDVASVK